MPAQGINGAYNNSFIIADGKEAWILETAGRQWTARKVDRDIASISNTLSIESKGDLHSPSLISLAIENKWWTENNKANFSFKDAYSLDIPSIKAQGKRAETRAACSLGLLKEKLGQITPGSMSRIARDRSTEPSLDLDVTASSCVAVLPGSPETFRSSGGVRDLRAAASIFRFLSMGHHCRTSSAGRERLKGGDRPEKAVEDKSFGILLLVAVPRPDRQDQCRQGFPPARRQEGI